MLRFIVLVAFAVALVLAIKEECVELGKAPALNCCKVLPPRDPIYESATRECIEEIMKSNQGPRTGCELEQCLGMKRGYMADDGTVDIKAFEAAIIESFKQSPELVKSIIKNCINGDVKGYGPEDFCEMKKRGYCIRAQVIMLCKEFDDKGQCSEIKNLVHRCAAE